jgi:hypothetical protein
MAIYLNLKITAVSWYGNQTELHHYTSNYTGLLSDAKLLRKKL